MTTKKATKKKAAKRKTARRKKTHDVGDFGERKVSELIPRKSNPRTHSKAQVAKIAASVEEWGWTSPILIDEKNNVLAGHGRLLAAAEIGRETVPVLVAKGWTRAQKRAYVIADNKLALEAGWNLEALTSEFAALKGVNFELSLTGFGDKELQGLLFDKELQGLLFDNSTDGLKGADANELPDVEKVVISKLGDVWILGRHRLACGDSTREGDVHDLFGALDNACLIIADPPYGMGKEKDGVANDNQYGEKLDAFQMSWWKVARTVLEENGSLYLWGNAPDLWRLWYTGGLALSGDLHVRNEIVWDKGTGFGMKSEGQHCYSPATERCLFLMRGQQFLGNQNKEHFAEEWEPLLSSMQSEASQAGWSVADVNKVTKTHMGCHWLTRSQFQPISRKHYAILTAAADGVAFTEDYDELFLRLFPGMFVKGEDPRKVIAAQIREARTYFDNAHDTMTDVWQFGRVQGDDRFGHATPKPVAMIGRAIKSSAPEDGIVFDPFCGTGTCIIAGELLRRRVYAMELEPAYVDVTIRRWQEQAGEAATLAGDGRTFAQIEAAGR